MIRTAWACLRRHAHHAAQTPIQYHCNRLRAHWQHTVSSPVNGRSRTDAPPTLYKPLPLRSGDSHTIRLLEILPATPSSTSTIHCRLHRIALSDAPVYSTVSYVWGDQTVTKKIKVNEESLTVRLNIWRFLQQMREEQHAGLLWIDAICINQNDVEERSRQVAIMGRIYSQAKEVQVWLGSGDARLVVALEKVRMARWPIGFGLDDAATVSMTTVGDSEMLQDLLMLGTLEYWRRLWIVEEFLLARRIRLRYGNEQIDAQTLRKALEAVRMLHQTYTTGDEDLAIDPETDAVNSLLRLPSTCLQEKPRQDEKFEQLTAGIVDSPMAAIFTARDYYQGWGRDWAAFNFPALVARYEDSQCLDVRDHVYELLPLTEGSAIDLGITPDYRRSTVDIFESMIELQLRSFKMAADVEEPPDVARDFVFETALSVQRAMKLDRGDERVERVLRMMEEGLQMSGRPGWTT